jgi:superoxide dismutase
VSKQVYFVVAVDLDEGVPFIDDDTFTARFSKTEQVWDTELNEWVEDEDQELYSQALEILNTKPLARD